MEWKGKNVVILGAARQGSALAAYVSKHGAKVKLSDTRNAEIFTQIQEELSELSIEWIFGKQDSSLLKRADYLSLSGGVSPTLPIVSEARKKGIQITNDSQIFLEICPCPVIGITGSSGKTTATMLVGRFLSAMKKRTAGVVWIGGNIGNPLISNVDEMSSDDISVIELSSFQLELMSRSPHVAVLLNIAPNHLDRHETMADYVSAKSRIFDFQKEDDLAILNREDFGSWSMRQRISTKTWSFGREKLASSMLGTFLSGKDIWLRNEDGETRLLPVSAIALRGEHNLSNVLAACCISAAVGATKEDMLAGLEDFKGVPHRLEFVRSLNGIDWYNDSIATSPQRAEASLNSFERPVVLLVGGRDKDLNWDNLAQLAAKKTKAILAFGEAAPLIDKVFEKHVEKDIKIEQFSKLENAVEAAKKIAQIGQVVLLAPGGTSFDEFEDFSLRGERYRELVNAL